MKIKFVTLAIFVMFLGSSTAQNFIGKLNPFPEVSVSRLQSDTLKILAIMVSFQDDKDDATFGTGKFESIYTQNYGSTILDPLPHNKNYFESHLEFVKNYFNKVSNGELAVQYTVLGDTFSVSKTMRHYSPAPNSTDFTPIGNFVKEAWTIAKQLNSGFDFTQYDVFLIFHAGVGRDISLPGSIGNERDLPSVYLSDAAIKNIIGSDLTGLPKNREGKYNSIIMPETESRELSTVSGKYLFEITINGLLVASVASHLGLPDLFDTNTGLSAIGRFGLMDGQAIFSYNGCFPPEPSAWEKIYLGWASPVAVDPVNFNVNLSAKLAASLSDTVILKVPISSTEYYLIENRQRDVNKDGAKVTFKSNGIVQQRTFLKDTTGFYSYDVDSLSGVILNVDEYDWALPGNGIVIWHIDENVINEKIADNKINTDKKRRGVDVEEADGIQDIGEKFVTIFGDEVIGEGDKEDFWFLGNESKLYKNRFSGDTRPDTKTNTGANSLITIKDFSASANKMSFKVEFGDSIIKPLFDFKSFSSNDALSLSSLIEDRSLLAANIGGNLIITDGHEKIDSFYNFSRFKTASVKLGANSYVLGNTVNPLLQFPGRINYWFTDGSTNNSGTVVSEKTLTTPPVIRKPLSENYEVLFGTAEGSILIYDLAVLVGSTPVLKSEIQIEPGARVKQISSSDSFIYAIAEKDSGNSFISYVFVNGTKIKLNNENVFGVASLRDKDGTLLSAVTTSKSGDFRFRVFLNDIELYSFKAPDENSLSNFAIADLKNDGNNYIITAAGNLLNAFNLNGAPADNFPFKIVNDEFAGLPLAADIEGDSKSEIIAFTKNGLVYAVDGGTGKVVDGFPISFGDELQTNAVLFYTNNKIALAGIDKNNSLKGWSISSVKSRIDWAENFGNNFNSAFIGQASSQQKINSFFPTNKAYNYPNPVYNGQTAIRYFVSEDSKVNIKIFDIAGDFVAELNDIGRGGFDNEIIWNVGNIQSGVYLARIQATSSKGQTESAIIKIAVVK